MKKLFLFLGALIWLLAACTPAGLEPAAEIPSAPLSAEIKAGKTAVSPTQPSPQPTEPPIGSEETARDSAAEAAPYIIFKRSGGFAGLEEEWQIFNDGRIQNGQGQQTGRLNNKAMQNLQQAIRDGHFFTLDEAYLPKDLCCDRFSYSVTVQEDGRRHTVSTIDDAGSAPEALWQIIHQISDLLAGSSGRES